MKLLAVCFNAIYIILPVNFKLVQFPHIPESGDQTVRVKKEKPDNKNNYCQDVFIPEWLGYFIYETEIDHYRTNLQFFF